MSEQVEVPEVDQVETAPQQQDRLAEQFLNVLDRAGQDIQHNPQLADTMLGELEQLTEEEFGRYLDLSQHPSHDLIKTTMDNLTFFRTYQRLADLSENTGIALPPYISPDLINQSEEELEAILNQLAMQGIVPTKRHIYGRGIEDITVKFQLGMLHTDIQVEFSSVSIPTFIVGCLSIQLLGILPNEGTAFTKLVNTVAVVKHFGSLDAVKARIETLLEEQEQADEITEEEDKVETPDDVDTEEEKKPTMN